MRGLLFFLFIFSSIIPSFSHADNMNCRSYIMDGNTKYCITDVPENETLPKVITEKQNDDGRKLPSKKELDQSTISADPYTVDSRDLDGPVEMLKYPELIDRKIAK